MPQSQDLILRPAVLEDWKDMYRNIWSKPESAQYMLWQVTTTEEAAIERMKRTIAFEKDHPYCWLVEEKASHEAIGFAGMIEAAPGIYSDCGIAIGPAFTGNGYGKQLLTMLTDYARDILRAHTFQSGYRIGNIPSMRMQHSCGFSETSQEILVDSRTGETYTLQYTQKKL